MMLYLTYRLVVCCIINYLCIYLLFCIVVGGRPRDKRLVEEQLNQHLQSTLTLPSHRTTLPTTKTTTDTTRNSKKKSTPIRTGNRKKRGSSDGGDGIIRHSYAQF